jgi:CheY-like chemotaxis protein
MSDAAARKGLTLDAIIMPDVGERHLGDPARIRQVLLHLLNNAVKFTDKGSITVVVESSRTSAGRIRFAVSDTGPGIASAKLDGLFDRFTQLDSSTSRRYGGTGLGLSIAKGLVEIMKGTIGVESEIGAGSVFWFDVLLPTTRQIAALPAPSPEAFNPIRMRVLVAEDTPISQTLIASMLENKGHAVTVVDNGQQALDALERESFDIVLMDIQMPVMDGLQATRLLRQRETSRRLPVIALTANALPADVDRCLAAGADVHLPKPIDWNSLDRTMERLISAGYARGLAARAS